MTFSHVCTCGYDATSAEDLRDHMAEMFTPDDDRAPDGQLHAQAANSRSIACLCGYQASGVAELDAHLADMFTPADRVGRDGFRHLPASPAPWWTPHEPAGQPPQVQ
jgi:hypothetical protein